jgi:class 3 adenylate cyclase
MHANRMEQAMLAKGVILRARARRLVATDPRTQRALQIDHPAAPAYIVNVPRPSFRRPFTVLVAPASLGQHQTADAMPAAIVFISDPERWPPISATLLQQLYGLSRAKAPVRIEVLCGEGLQAAAKKLRISDTTARTHLHRHLSTRPAPVDRPLSARPVERARVKRRLAAILTADIVGYSRLMGADDEGTLVRLKAHHDELVAPKIKEYRGRIVRTMGDGLLVMFTSVVDAMHCAVDVQRRMFERNAQVSRERRIELRIAINVGDIIIDGRDIHGDGVNVAARLEQLAEPGGICVSDRVREDVEGKFDIAFEDTGEQQLKNIARPVRVYRVRLGGSAVRAASLVDKPSIPIPAFPGAREIRKPPDGYGHDKRGY